MSVIYKITREINGEEQDIEIECWLDRDGELDWSAPKGIVPTKDEQISMAFKAQEDADEDYDEYRREA